MILSEQIKLCRKQLGMSQADLADAIWEIGRAHV